MNLFDELNLREKEIKSLLSTRCSAAKSRAKKKGMAFELTTAILFSKFKEQKGRCYWSGHHMTVFKGKYIISVERIDPNIGYTIENTVLVVNWVNTAKGRLVEKEFKEGIGELHHNMFNN